MNKITIKRMFLFILSISYFIGSNAQIPLPTAAQVEWQKLETYAFIHFGQNTFNDVEWGYGDADPKNFNPTNFDCEQWVKALKDGGMKAVIITAKHHDGFCLWPSKYTDYTIAASPYKGGKGDIVGEVAAACRKHGLKFGVYLSPWDRHQAIYGTPEYIEYYKNQMTELLTNYGDIFEVWLDGANGGDGYYGGAREERKIDRRTYYHFDELFALIHKLQPNAVIFSDGGPGCRWVGNENGVAGETNWSFLREGVVYPGYPNNSELTSGHSDGTQWIPAECDVSIRPGWFYHAKEDSKVRTGKDLFELYLKNVGRNGNFILNVPPTKEGLIHPIDVASLAEFNNIRKHTFANDLLLHAKIKGSSNASKIESAKNTNDSNYDSYWSPKDGDASPTLNIKLKKLTPINYVVLQEYIPKGQHVEKFVVEYKNSNGAWTLLPTTEQTTTIGYKRILPIKKIETKELRVRFTSWRQNIYISEVAAYYAE